MREDAVDLQVRERADRPVPRGGLAERGAETREARVDLEVHPRRAAERRRGLADRARAVDVPHDEDEVLRDGMGDLGRIRRAVEHEDRTAHTRLAEDLAFLDRRDRHHDRAGLEARLRDRFRSVAVRVGFHDRDHVGPGPGADRRHVIGDRVEVDVRDGGADGIRGHRVSTISRSARGSASTMSVASAPDSPISPASRAPARP